MDEAPRNRCIGTYSILLSITRFNNIDLTDKGYYGLRYLITDVSRTILAHPISLAGNLPDHDPRNHLKEKPPQLAKILFDGKTVLSSAVWIEYEKESYEMQDFVFFEIEVNVDTPIILHFEFVRSKEPDLSRETPFSKKSIQINNIGQSVNTYWPLYPDGIDSSSYDIVVHTSMKKFTQIRHEQEIDDSFLGRMRFFSGRIGCLFLRRPDYGEELTDLSRNSFEPNQDSTHLINHALYSAVKSFTRLTNIIRYSTVNLSIDVLTSKVVKMHTPQLLQRRISQTEGSEVGVDGIDIQIQQEQTSTNIWSEENTAEIVKVLLSETRNTGESETQLLDNVLEKVAKLWANLKELYPHIYLETKDILRKEWRAQNKQHFRHLIYQERNSLRQSKPSDARKTTNEIPNTLLAEHIRKALDFNKLDAFELHQHGSTNSPIFFEDCYSDVIRPKIPSNSHIVIYVHGYEGSPYDCRAIRCTMTLLYPNHIHYISTSNDGGTKDDIRKQGERLAIEICEQVKTIEHKTGEIPAISFVGFSLGGIIIRSAIRDPNFQPYIRHLNSYISFCTPHLGATRLNRFLVSSSAYFMGLVSQQNASLRQLLLKDGSGQQPPYLVDLSRNSELELFRNIVLVSSPQDGYVPNYSAKIDARVHRDNAVLVEMEKNLSKSLESTNTRSIEIAYCMTESDLSSYIGQKAHVLILDGGPFLLSLLDHLNFCFEHE